MIRKLQNSQTGCLVVLWPSGVEASTGKTSNCFPLRPTTGNGSRLPPVAVATDRKCLLGFSVMREKFENSGLKLSFC